MLFNKGVGALDAFLRVDFSTLKAYRKEKTMITIEGWKITSENFSDHYSLQNYLGFNTGYIEDKEPLTEIIPNVRVQIYKCPCECLLEEAQEFIISKYFGDCSIESQDYGYSEYTICGFDVYEFKIGKHNLLEILKNMDGYKIVTIEKVGEKK